MKKYLRRLVTENDLFNIFIIVVAFILSYLGTWTIIDGKKDLNSQYPIFLYVTLATLISSILDPLLEIKRVESKKKRLMAITFGTIISLLIFLWSLSDNSVLVRLQLISTHGGMSAISAAFLLLNLAYINYQLQKIREEELNEEKRKHLEEKRKHLEDKLKLKATLEEKLELEERVLKLEGRTNE